jgi:hypothetical protein
MGDQLPGVLGSVVGPGRADSCGSTFSFPEMHTYFECQNPPDKLSRSATPNRPSWTHLHGRWHFFEDVDGDGRRFRVEWEDVDD